MTSRQIILDTLEHNGPVRVPRQMWTLPWAENTYPGIIAQIHRQFPSDFEGVAGELKTPTIARGDPYNPGEYVDEWGCRFVNINPGIWGEVKNPQIPEEDENWDSADQVHIPYELLSFDIDQVNAAIAQTGHEKFFPSGCCPRPFEQLQFIRGTENLYMDLMDPPKGMLDFMGKMHQFYCDLMEKWAKTDVDSLNFMDDWGSQRALLISPALWKQYFLPMYRDYIDIAHSHGKKCFMHSDGYILDIIPSLAEAGLDAINSQLFCMGLDKLKPLKGKITFWGEIDRQHLLPYATETQIRQAVHDVYDALWDHGGCIAQLEFGAGAKPENVMAVYDEWDKISQTLPGKG